MVTQDELNIALDRYSEIPNLQDADTVLSFILEKSPSKTDEEILDEFVLLLSRRKLRFLEDKGLVNIELIELGETELKDVVKITLTEKGLEKIK